MPIFCQENVHFRKRHTALKLKFIKKRSISQKHCVLMFFFFNFLTKNPCFQAHIWSKKRQLCQKYTLLWAKKVNKMSLFSDLHKSKCYHAHIL